MIGRMVLAACVMSVAVGCGSSTPTGGSGKEIEAQQKAEQQKADDEEREENKARAARRKANP